MEDYRARRIVTIVGFVDLGAVFLSIVGTLVFAVGWPVVPLFLDGENTTVFRDLLSSYGIHNETYLTQMRNYTGRLIWQEVWIASGVDCLVSGVQVGAAVLLINAAALERIPRRSLQRVLFWMMVNLSVLVGYTIWRLLDRQWLVLLLAPLYRLLLFCPVLHFMVQLWRLRRVADDEPHDDDESAKGGNKLKLKVRKRKA